MASSRTQRRTVFHIVCLAALTTRVVHAEDERHECATTAYDGQRLRDEGKLTDARASFLQCASPKCPGVIAADCSKWVSEVDARLPTVAPSARDPGGHDLLNVRVAIDGRRVLESLDGRSLPVNPGKHVIRFEAVGFAAHEETLLIGEGQKARSVSVVLRPTGGDSSTGERTSSAAQEGPALWPALVTGGVGVVGLGAFAFFGLSGQSDKNRLNDTCAPSGSCLESDVSSVRTKLVLADVSLGVGIVSLGAATYFLVRHLNGAPPPKTSRISIDVTGSAGNAACTVGGSF